MLFAIVLIMLAAILFSPLDIALRINQTAAVLPSFNLSVDLRLFLRTKAGINIFNREFSAESALNFKKNKTAAHGSFNLMKILKYISIRRLKIELAIGTGSAASTCLISGSIFAALNMFFVGQGRRFGSIPPPPYLFIKPVFDKAVFQIQAECIAGITLGNIIIIILKLLFMKIKGDVINGRRQRRDKAFNRNIYEQPY